MLETSHTGGYRSPNGTSVDPIEESFPTPDTERLNSIEPTSLATTFLERASQSYPRTQLRMVGQLVVGLIRKNEALNLALRSAQEFKMRAQRHLVDHANVRLASNSDLCGDICELHRLGDIPEFRAPSP